MMRTVEQAVIILICCIGLAFAVTVIVQYAVSTGAGTSDADVAVDAFRPRRQFDPAEYAPARVVKPFPAIVEIPVKRGSDVRDEVRDDELVLGVEVGGAFRAYPINQMTGPVREVFNDTLGGKAIAATW